VFRVVFDLQPDRLDAFLVKGQTEYGFTLHRIEHRGRHADAVFLLVHGSVPEKGFIPRWGVESGTFVQQSTGDREDRQCPRNRMRNIETAQQLQNFSPMGRNFCLSLQSGMVASHKIVSRFYGSVL